MFPYRINVPSPTKAAPAIDLVLRKAVRCRAISASSGPFFLGSNYSSNEESRDRHVSVFFSEWVRWIIYIPSRRGSLGVSLAYDSGLAGSGLQMSSLPWLVHCRFGPLRCQCIRHPKCEEEVL